MQYVARNILIGPWWVTLYQHIQGPQIFHKTDYKTQIFKNQLTIRVCFWSEFSDAGNHVKFTLAYLISYRVNHHHQY